MKIFYFSVILMSSEIKESCLESLQSVLALDRELFPYIIVKLAKKLFREINDFLYEYADYFKNWMLHRIAAGNLWLLDAQVTSRIIKNIF